MKPSGDLSCHLITEQSNSSALGWRPPPTLRLAHQLGATRCRLTTSSFSVKPKPGRLGTSILPFESGLRLGTSRSEIKGESGNARGYSMYGILGKTAATWTAAATPTMAFQQWGMQSNPLR